MHRVEKANFDFYISLYPSADVGFYQCLLPSYTYFAGPNAVEIDMDCIVYENIGNIEYNCAMYDGFYSKQRLQYWSAAPLDPLEEFYTDVDTQYYTLITDENTSLYGVYEIGFNPNLGETLQGCSIFTVAHECDG